MAVAPLNRGMPRRRVATCAALAVLGLGAAARAQSADLDTLLPPEQARRELAAVTAEVRERAARGERPVVVFDVDDTLVDSHGGFPTPAQIEKPEPLPGAVEYVHALARAGATIVYLTGRPEAWRKDAELQLERAHLPLGGPHRVMLNPVAQPAYLFKGQVRPQILALGTPIAFFDNEKRNIRVFREQYPEARVFRLKTTSYYSDPGGKGPVHVIDSFPKAAPLPVRAPLPTPIRTSRLASRPAPAPARPPVLPGRRPAAPHR